jgi:hypothetical protein
MRRVSIGCGKRDKLIAELERMTEELRQHGSTEMDVEPNMGGSPRLRLEFVDESDPEWEEPLVDYAEGG